MKVTGKSIREDLARAKAAYAKNDEARTLRLLALSLKAFVALKPTGPDRTAIEGQFREVFGLIGKLDHVKKLVPKGVPYLKGQEAKLFNYLVPLVKKVEEEINKESLEAMRERKLRIDQSVIKGRKFLEEDNILEAMRNFRAAVDDYVDEDGLFPLLTSILIDKGCHKQALEYLKRALEISPANPRGYDFLLTALAGSKEWELGEKILRDQLKKTPDQPLVPAHLAFILAKTGKLDEAAALARQAPGVDIAQKTLALLEKRQGA